MRFIEVDEIGYENALGRGKSEPPRVSWRVFYL